MKEFWSYTGLRIALFVAVGAVVWGAYVVIVGTVNYVYVFVIAAVISSLVSWRLLAGPRNRLAASIDARAHRAASRFEEIKAREDQD